MKYKKYHNYEDSGVDWLGKIPLEWDKLCGKRLFKNRRKSPFLSDEQLAVTQKYGVIPQNIFMKKENQKVVLALKGTDNFKHVEENDYVISLRSFQGGIEYSTYKGCVSPAYTVLYNTKEIEYQYYKSLFKSQPYILALQSSTDSLREGKSITYDQFGAIFLPLPPIHEQQQIAKFLDNTTQKMDTLIQKQENLIKLLKEKRQAVIYHAVTRGLNPDVKMKDSGVEWLGDVPEHWDINKLRYVFKFSTGLSITRSDLKDKGIPCVSYGEVHSKYGFEVSAEKNVLKCVDESYLINSKNSLIAKGDFIFADTSEDLEGAGNFTHLSGEIQVFAGYHTIIARLISENNYYRFIAYLLDSQSFRKQIRLAVKGVKVFSITQAILKNCINWIPPIEEQQQIADYLDNKTSKIDTLIEKSKQSIVLLKEKRTALISAAVTGKIDVRKIV